MKGVAVKCVWCSVGLSISTWSRCMNKLKTVCMSHIGSSTFYMFCFLHCALKLQYCYSYGLLHYANNKTNCRCLFPQLHSLSYGQNVYIAPFSIMLSSSVCCSNSFLAFKHRSLLVWLCSNMTGPLWIETHDKGDLQLSPWREHRWRTVVGVRKKSIYTRRLGDET